MAMRLAAHTFMLFWGCVVSLACESTTWRRVLGIAGHLDNTRMSNILNFQARVNASVLRFISMLETGSNWQNTLQYEHLQLLLQISHQGVATQQQLTDDAVSCLEQQVNQQRQAQQAMQQDLHQQQEASQTSHHTQEAHAKHHRHGRSWHKRCKLIGAVVWGVASLLQHNNLPLRAVKAASLLYVIHEHGRR